MTRVVLDTNGIVSATLKPQGLEAAVLLLGLQGIVELCVSQAILTEYQGVLGRPRFERDPKQISRFLAQLESHSSPFQPTRTLSACSDEPDNRFLECAEAAGADYLVIGNKRHFPKTWKNTKVVNTQELLVIISAGLR